MKYKLFGIFYKEKLYVREDKPTIHATSEGRMYYETGNFFSSKVIQDQIKKLESSALVNKINSRN